MPRVVGLTVVCLATRVMWSARLVPFQFSARNRANQELRSSGKDLEQATIIQGCTMSRYCYYVALLCLGMVACLAQVSTGTMVGVVEDPSGATIPNAEISLTKTNTNETRQTRATAGGEFNIPFLQIG